MAYDNTPVDLNTGSSGIVLPREISSEIWAKATQESAVMRMARRIYLPGAGITVPIIDTDGVADIVTETGEKPVSNPTVNNKSMTPIKIAMIQTFSNEFRRDLPRLYDALVDRAPAAITKKFDELAFHGTNNPTGFDTLANATAISIATDTYPALVSAKSTVAAADGMLNGWALSPQAEAVLLAATDGQDRPLFLNSATDQGSVGRILGEPVYFNRASYQAGTPNTLGIAGDWDRAMYGIVDDITIKISDQATINDGTKQINLWQRNMFAILVEATLGFAVQDDAYFVRLTD